MARNNLEYYKKKYFVYFIASVVSDIKNLGKQRKFNSSVSRAVSKWPVSERNSTRLDTKFNICKRKKKKLFRDTSASWFYKIIYKTLLFLIITLTDRRIIWVTFKIFFSMSLSRDNSSGKHNTSTASSRTSSRNYSSPLSLSPNSSPRGGNYLSPSMASPGGTALTPYYSSPLTPIDNYHFTVDEVYGRRRKRDDGNQEIHLTNQVS